ncbi:MAG: hypothetical protein C0478_07650 [Planctomyces sp.]|nr:hypothetical protein [Planctomyces sp.]
MQKWCKTIIMNEKQACSQFAMEKRVGALGLILVSVIAGLFAIFPFPGGELTFVVVGSVVSGVTGFGAVVLLFSASRVVERQQQEELESLYRPPSEAVEATPLLIVETEARSPIVGLASAMAIICFFLISLIGLVGRLERRANQAPAHHQNHPQKEPTVGQMLLPGYELSVVEQQIMRDVLSHGGVVYLSKDKKHIFAIDFSSNGWVNDAMLEQYCQDLPGLRGLDLRHTQVTDDGVRHLERMVSLYFVRLGGTVVSSEQITALEIAFPACKIDTDTE